MCATALGFVCSQGSKETSKVFLLSMSQQCVCLVQGNAQEIPPKHWGWGDLGWLAALCACLLLKELGWLVRLCIQPENAGKDVCCYGIYCCQWCQGFNCNTHIKNLSQYKYFSPRRLSLCFFLSNSLQLLCWYVAAGGTNLSCSWKTGWVKTCEKSKKGIRESELLKSVRSSYQDARAQLYLQNTCAQALSFPFFSFPFPFLLPLS